MANTVSYIYEILDRYSTPLRKIAQRTDQFERKLKRAQRGAIGLSKKMDHMANRAQNLQGALGALGLGAALAKVVQASSTMEDAMQDIARVTDISAEGLAAMEGRLEALSEKLGTSKRGLAEMAYEGGRLGVSVENMEAFLMLTSRTAISFDMMDKEAARALGSIRAKMGLAGDGATELMDSINYLADNTSANGARMIEITERLSGTFKILELPPGVAAAFAGFADQVEVTPQLAASGMSMMIRKMREMPGMTKKMMSDPISAVNEQLERMAKMGPELRTRFMEKMFGAEASRFVEKAVANIELFGKTVETALSPAAKGSMQRELENQMLRSSKTFQVFGVVITNTLDTLGDVIKPFAVSAAKFLIKIVQAVRQLAAENPAIVKFIAGVAALTVVFTGAAVAAGLLMAALAPIVGTLAAFALPITATIIAVSALAVMFNEWLASGHPIISMLKEMGSDLVAIIAPFGELLGIAGSAGDMFGGLGGFIEKFGFAIMAALTPVRLLLKAMKGVAQAGAAILSGNFAEAFEALKNSGGEIMATGLEGLQSAGAALGIEGAQAAAAKSAQQDVNISGNIGISAAKGTKVDNADIKLNGGSNLAYGG